MASRTDSALSAPFGELLATPTSRLPYQQNVLLRSFVLLRPSGTVVVYNSPGIGETTRAIAELGTTTDLLVNHAHEAMYGTAPIDAPVRAHRRDRAEIGDSMRVDEVFENRHHLHDDLEVIPTPGHTPGTTSFLWDSGRHRYLFTGDFIWVEDGEWKAVVLDEGLRRDYVESLETVRDLSFDVLVPWGVTEGDEPAWHVRDDTEKRDRVQAIIDRVAAGGDR